MVGSKFYGVVLTLLICGVVSIQVSHAAGADDLHARAIAQSHKLLEFSFEDLSARHRLRENTVQLAQTLKTLAFEETERRSAKKAELPSSLTARPGATRETVDVMPAPGEAKRLLDVPTAWFNAMLEKARKRTDDFLTLLEANSNDSETLKDTAQNINQLVDYINRPPKL